VLLVVVVLAFAAYVYVANNDKAETSSVTTEPVNAESPRPGFIPVANVDVAPQPSMHPIGHVAAGDTVGLYGGTQTNACDAARIGRFLDANPQLANAWAQALRIQPGEIHLYLASLTALALRTDTAVTNHGYENGVANPFQSVLQSGTAVLVDAEGLPRVRCRCGNPLQTPAPPRQNVRYVGPTWKGFEAESVTVIRPAPKEVKVFVVVDHDNKVKSRPRATSGTEDRDADPSEAATAYRNLSANKIDTTGGSSDGDRRAAGPSTDTTTSPAGTTTAAATTGSADPIAIAAPGSTATSTGAATAVETGTVGPTATLLPPVPDSNAPNTAVASAVNDHPNTTRQQPVDPEPQDEHSDNQQPDNEQPDHQQPDNQQPDHQQSDNEQQSDNQQADNK
jgi:hypothetical protein